MIWFINKKVLHIKYLYGKNKKIPKYLKDNEIKKIIKVIL